MNRGKGETVHATAQRIDRSMAATNRILRKFGTPQGVGQPLTGLKRSVGDVIAQLEMVERREQR